MTEITSLGIVDGQPHPNSKAIEGIVLNTRTGEIMGSVEADELRHDQDSVDPTPYMADALESIIEDLMTGSKVRGLGWGLQDFLEWQTDLHELVSAAVISRDWRTFLDDQLEKRLRAVLENDDAVYDRAAELAREES